MSTIFCIKVHRSFETLFLWFAFYPRSKLFLFQYDSPHFGQIYTELTNEICTNMPNSTGQKLCFKELSDPKTQESMRTFLADQEPKNACEYLFFC